MDKNQGTTQQAQSEETAEEIIGVLNAISVISKRMAKKLALLEAKKEGEAQDGKPTTAHADQGSAV